MFKTGHLFWIASLALAMTSSHAHALNSVTIMADNTLSTAIAEIARHYSREHNLVVNTSFASMSAQEAQITEGGAADILITPKQAWIDELKTQGLIDIYSPTPVARNRLALVGPTDSPLEVKLSEKFPAMGIINQIEGEPGFVVGNPETQSVGISGKEAMRNLDVTGDMEEYTLYVKRQGQMLEMIPGMKAYGVFYYSTVMNRPDMKVLDLFPETSYTPIKYYAVVIAGENMDEARKFLEYLKTADAKRVLHENGFATD